jgi:RNA polymerase sigma-70 factor (ECF subfamily)
VLVMSEAPEAVVFGDDSGSTLARRFADGDPRALEAVYAEHGALVHSFCRRSLDPARAADATQDVFLAAWRSRERYRPEAGTLAGWLLGIARFKVVDILRADGRQPSLVADPAVAGATTFDRPVEAGGVTSIGERMLVAEALAGLSDRAREMVRLAFYADLTHAEIADRTGVPLGTVKSDIRRGLEQMRRHLGGFDDVGP